MKYPVESTIDTLPFEELTWERFERLCRDIFVEEYPNLTNIREYLSQGHEQYGIDLRGFDPDDGKYVFIQSKRKKSFTGTDLEEAVVKFKEGKFFSEAKVFIICVSSKVNEAYESKISELEKRLASYKIEFLVWDEVSLNRILKRFPQIVFDIFDRGALPAIYTRAFNGQESQKKLLHQPSKRNYPKLENYIPRQLTKINEIGIRIENSIIEAIEGISNYIIIKSEATYGKTTELEFAAHYFSVLEGGLFYPIFISLKNYISETFDSLLKEYFYEDWRKVPQNKLLLLLDGFDEIKTEEREVFLGRLGTFIKSCPEAKIVISSRANFIAGSSLLTEFSIYTLSEFSKEEIRLYVSNFIPNEKEITKFFEYIENRKIQNWISSPFNLTNLIELYNADSTNLPSTRIELIKQILDLHLEKDFFKYRISDFEKLKYRRVLSNLALSFSLYGVNAVSKENLTKVFGMKEIEVLRKISIVNFDDSNVFFKHNVFQEYLTAEILSHKSYASLMELISFKPDFVVFKPKWYNTIGILIELLAAGTKDLKELLLGISNKDSSILNSIEYKFIPVGLRFEIFKRIVSNPERIYRKNEIDTYKLSQFVEIDENEEAFDFLLELIKESKEEVRNEALHCLLHIERKAEWLDSEELAIVFFKILKDDLVSEYTKSLCFDVLRKLKISEESIEELSLVLIDKTKDFRFIDKVLAYLNCSNRFEEFIDIYLNKVQDLDRYNSMQNSVVGYGSHFQKGLLQFEKLSNIHRILDYLINNIDDVLERKSIFVEKFYSNESFFDKFLENLIKAYQNDKFLYEKVLLLLTTSKPEKLRKYLGSLIEFFVATRTNDRAFWQLWEVNKDYRIKLLLGLLIDDSLLKTIIDQYKKNSFSDSEIWSLINYMNWVERRNLAEEFRQKVNDISNSYFIYTVEPDYKKIEQIKKSRDYELLMDKVLFKEKALDFFVFFDSNSLSQTEVLSYMEAWEECDNNVVPFFLNNWFQGVENEVLTQEEVHNWFASKSEGWNWYVIGELSDMVDNEIPLKCFNYVQEWCNKAKSMVDFRTAITEKEKGHFSVRKRELYYSIFFKKLNINVPKVKQLEMLSFDLESNIKSVNEEPEETITEKVIRLQGKEAVLIQFLDNLKFLDLPYDVLQNHVSWCEELKITESTESIAQCIKKYRSSENFGLANMLSIYLKLGGDVRVFTFIFNEFDMNFDLHWDILKEMVAHQFFKRKIVKLLKGHIDATMPNAFLLKSSIFLVSLGDIEGLKRFSLWFKGQQRIPDTIEFVENIDRLDFDEAFVILEDLMRHIISKNFSDFRFTNPIGQILHLLAKPVYINETRFNKCVYQLNEINKSIQIENNIYRYKSEVNHFIDEYYLQKVDFENYSETKAYLA
ncbi:NACHT domain-containing protein [uncultured Arcticibacterium sp.]|uniref:NACHT domain-containing protein n=1 Tax=uncultured Arcticibacterium sp. TaxID=2173042 RepID=UPI0030FD124B